MRTRAWIVACRLGGGLAPTKSSYVPSIFAFPKYLQRKRPKSRTDPDERRQKQRNTTDVEEYETVYLQKETRRWTGTNGLWLERRIFCFWRSQYRPLCVEAEIQTDLTASYIEVIAHCKEKLQDKTQLKRDLYVEGVCKNDQIVRFTLAFHHWLAYGV